MAGGDLMSIIWADFKWTPFVLGKLARNWRQTPEGSDVRMGNQGRPLQLLAGQTNRVLARHPSVHFHMGWPITGDNTFTGDTSGLNPLCRWRRPDYQKNARHYEGRIIGFPRTAGSGDAYAEYEGGTASQSTPVQNFTAATLLCPEHNFEASYPVDRGAAANGEVVNGVSTYNGYGIHGIVVQDEYLTGLDTAVHDYCDPTVAKSGQTVLEDLFEDIRSTFHDKRRYGMGMAFCWAGTDPDGGSTPAVPGDKTAFATDSSTYVNLLDQTVTAWSTSSPGIPVVPARYRGRGTIAKTAGQTCRMDFRVYAESASGTAYVEAVHPNGATEVEITSGGGLDWYGTGGSHIDLNTNVNDQTETGATRNKVDLLFKVASGTVYVRGIAAFYWYE